MALLKNQCLSWYLLKNDPGRLSKIILKRLKGELLPENLVYTVSFIVNLRICGVKSGKHRNIPFGVQGFGMNLINKPIKKIQTARKGNQ